jgi:hypothetical protein
MKEFELEKTKAEQMLKTNGGDLKVTVNKLLSV